MKDSTSMRIRVYDSIVRYILEFDEDKLIRIYYNLPGSRRKHIVTLDGFCNILEVFVKKKNIPEDMLRFVGPKLIARKI